ncbi:LptF/LptG family permease [Geofilum sp. OHC36d9]|uniref:LptF/LptG family permease n=1 Tax=Geofilum sp. OHC36d9 TaxID=3458413 RepID=UPI00403490D4
MKRLNLFILKSYSGPLIMTFFISMFILVMQFLWRYVDDLVGKGLEWHVMGELLFYASLQVVPMALPLAILLASLMSFGNMGENYELIALKSAGVSLLKIMKPITVLTVTISLLAYAFSNNVLPVANLKLVSILHGIRQTRLELDIKERVFYQGVEDFTIKVERKNRDGSMLHDVMIYDHRDRQASNSNVTLADSGKLQMSKDKRNLVLTLYDGVRYDEKIGFGKNSKNSSRDKSQFRTDVFGSEKAIIQLEGFDFSKTNESLFKQGDRMKNLSQLSHDLDSIRGERQVFINSLKTRSSLFYFNKVQQPRDKRLPAIDSATVFNLDSLYLGLNGESKLLILQNASRISRDQKQVLEDQMRFIDREDTRIRRHLMELHRKFTLSFACLIFFFIGAPLGAIIRKGGLGMPVVISIFFFIIYYIVDTMGAKFAREGVWEVYQGMWLSSFVLLPIGIFLTYKSATDSPLLNSDAYFIAIHKFKKRMKSFRKKD